MTCDPASAATQHALPPAGDLSVRPRISIVTPCFNEEENVERAYGEVKKLFASLGMYRYEHLFIDNASTDRTVAILRRIAAGDQNVRVIVNSRNFGHVRSPMHGLLQARGAAAIFVVADLQDPLSLVPAFLEHWERGAKSVLGVKVRSKERPLMFLLRRIYYRLVNSLAEIDLVENFYGFGLYDRTVIEAIRAMDDPYPYGRGMICEIGFQPVKIEYTQNRRERGITKNNFYTLYDIAMLGITSHSKVPLRLATMLGFSAATLSFLAGLVYFVYKLLFWQNFSVGMAPLVVGLFFFGSVQLFFIGILGEYIGAIHTQVVHRPLVVERERINFDPPQGGETAANPSDTASIGHQASIVADPAPADRHPAKVDA
jgi:glycosyltransferase involved in cell wall biosynthesis